MSELIPDVTFNPEAFSGRLDELSDSWKARWAGPQTGPQRVPKRMKPYLSAEQLVPLELEEDAYDELVDYAARGIITAMATGEHESALEIVFDTARKVDIGSIERDSPQVVRDVFQRTIKLVAESQEISR